MTAIALRPDHLSLNHTDHPPLRSSSHSGKPYWGL